MLRASLGLLAIVLAVGGLFIGVSLSGRGTRDAVGVKKNARSGALDIVYHEQGTGPTVVLLASLARPASDFNELAAALGRAGFRTLAIESRGIGGSDGGGPLARTTLPDLAADVEAVLQASGLPAGERVHVIGHAFGNRVARTFATDFPARARSVVLIAAGGRASVSPRIRQAIFISCLSFLPWSLREPELRLGFFAPGSEIPPYWRLGWSYWGALGQIHATNAGKSPEFWHGGEAPMLVLQASSDAIARAEDAGLALAAEFPERVTLVDVPDAGHALLPEQPARIEAAVLSFLLAQQDAQRREQPSDPGDR